jgi:hypothetical protein
VLRRIFEPKRDEMRGKWRRLHNEELYNLNSSPNVVHVVKSRRKIRVCAGHVARMGDRKCTYRILVRRTDGKRSLGRLRRKWENNIKMDLQEVGWGGKDWIVLTQDKDR